MAAAEIAGEPRVAAAGTAAIREVLQRGRIEVPVGGAPLNSDRQFSATARVLVRERADARHIAPALHIERGPVSADGAPSRVKCDHASQPPAVFGRDARSKDCDCLELGVLERRREGYRAVVVQGHAVDYVLRIVLGPPWVEHGIGFQQPSGHRRDHVDGTPAQSGSQGPLEVLAPGPRALRRPVRLEQGRGRANGDFLPDRGHGECDLDDPGNCRLQCDAAFRNLESLVASCEQVGAWRNAMQGRSSFGVGDRARDELGTSRD